MVGSYMFESCNCMKESCMVGNYTTTMIWSRAVAVCYRAVWQGAVSQLGSCISERCMVDLVESRMLDLRSPQSGRPTHTSTPRIFVDVRAVGHAHVETVQTRS
jgi:hypothetical protein